MSSSNCKRKVLENEDFFIEPNEIPCVDENEIEERNEQDLYKRLKRQELLHCVMDGNDKGEYLNKLEEIEKRQQDKKQEEEEETTNPLDIASKYLSSIYDDEEDEYEESFHNIKRRKMELEDFFEDYDPQETNTKNDNCCSEKEYKEENEKQYKQNNEKEEEEEDDINESLSKEEREFLASYKPPIESFYISKNEYDTFYNDTVIDYNYIKKISKILDEKVKRKVTHALIQNERMGNHQISSYNKLLSYTIPHIVNESGMMTIDVENRRHVVRYDNVSVLSPCFRESDGEVRPITPQECRLRGLTYSCPVICDSKYTTFDITGMTKEQLSSIGNDSSSLKVCEIRVNRGILLFHVPCMLKCSHCVLTNNPNLAGECPFEHGGIFVINGNDKVIISQEKLRMNFPCVFPIKQPNRFSHICEVRSCHESKIRSTSTMCLKIGSSGCTGTNNTNNTNNNISTVTTPVVGIVASGINNNSNKKEEEVNFASRNDIEIVATLPFIEKNPIPIIVMFKLLGVKTLEDMKKHIMEHSTRKDDLEMERLLSCIFHFDGYSHMSDMEMYAEIGKKVLGCEKEKQVKTVEHIFANELIPHIGLDRKPETCKKKVIYLSHCVYKLCSVRLNRLKPDDKDHNANRRFDTAGPIMALMVRYLYRNTIKSSRSLIKKSAEQGKIINIDRCISDTKITANLKYFMSTGNYGTKKNASNTKGVAQQQVRMTITSYLSNIRKVNAPASKEGKMTKMRQLHLSYWGIICPAETPEGQPCGLIKNLALSCHIRTGYDPNEIYKWFERRIKKCERLQEISTFIPIDSCDDIIRSNHVMVTINGMIVGYDVDGHKTVKDLRNARKLMELPYDMGIVYLPGQRQLRIYGEPGCCCRPLFRVDGLHRLDYIIRNYSVNPTLLIQQLLMEGVIEYLCKEEEYTCRVALDMKDLLESCKKENVKDKHFEPFTHLEIHPLLLLGVAASLIPFSNHNQSPRNTYQVGMSKQCMSSASMNAHLRNDTYTMNINYPEIPIVRTMTEDMIGTIKSPMGTNLIMAILTYGGYNQEDSVILNQSSLDRGMFRSFVRRTYKDEEKTRGANSTKLEKPPSNCYGKKTGDYTKMNDAGFVPPGTRVKKNDAIIGKTMMTEKIYDNNNRYNDTSPFKEEYEQPMNKTMYMDNSTILKIDESAVVDQVIETKNRDSYKAYRMTIMSHRMPIDGDKYCLSPDHLVLTDSGWKKYTDLDKNKDKVATLKDGKLVYDKIIEIYEFDHDGDMYSIKSNQVNLMTTLNHKMYVKPNKKDNFELITAKDIYGKKVCYKKDVNWECEKLNTINDINLLCIGFLIANNSKLNKKNDDTVRFFIDNNITLNSQILDRLGYINESNYLILNNNKLFDYVSDYQYELPKWVWKLNKEQCRILLNGMFYKETNRLIHNISLCDEIQRLILHSGWSSNIEKGNDIVDSIILYKSEMKPIFDSNLKSCKELLVHYTGKVFCIEVPSHVFYVKRNGIPVWTGNSSRHGQKGTAGISIRREDMPFTAQGITPDIIVNPHAIPTRMTIGKLIEGLLAKLCVLNGEFGDGTPFCGTNVRDIANELRKKGVSGLGKEMMYHGHTGKPIEALIFLVPMYYQKLRHVATDKLHGRSTGPNQTLTRQPVEGKSRGGGLRFGEMERDCLISYGASSLLKERLHDQSDAYQAPVCTKCGLFAILARPKGMDIKGFTVRAKEHYCKTCETGEFVKIIQIPYSYKLFTQEANGCNITPRLRFDEDDIVDKKTEEEEKELLKQYSSKKRELDLKEDIENVKKIKQLQPDLNGKRKNNTNNTTKKRVQKIQKINPTKSVNM